VCVATGSFLKDTAAAGRSVASPEKVITGLEGVAGS
jgi:hypothetical protein